MRLVHLSDLHLGYRQYQRLTAHGINQREADVARTFQRAIDQIVALRPSPELIVVAGDVFHTSRPTNAAILHAFRQFARLRAELPASHVVMIAGGHDTPRTTESGSIMGLFEQLGVHVAAHEARRFSFEDLGVAVLGVPDVPGPTPALTPDPRARHNVLVMHADVEDVVPRYYADLDRANVKVSRRDLGLDQWSYVALGHYHVHQSVNPEHKRSGGNAFYSGSLDYTSLNVWYDLAEEAEHGRTKGFIEFDLDAGRPTFHAVAPARAFLDLRPISARDMSPAEVDAAIARAIEKTKGGIDDKVVRLVIRDIPRQVARELDQRAIREYKRRALSFLLDTRKPESTRRDAAGSPARRPSVLDVVRAQLSAREIPPDLDRARLVELGMRYLGDADAMTARSAGMQDIEA